MECLREIARFALQGMEHHRPFNSKGSLRRKDSNEEKCIRHADLLRSVVVVLAAFEAPKLAPIKVAPPPPDEPVTMTLNIFNSHGKHVKTVRDGETLWETEDSP